MGLVAGDFNGDGAADLAVANSNDNSVTVLLGNGAGAFTEPAGSPIAIGTSPFSLTIADINGDGIEDLITVNSSDNSLTLLFGNGAGGFTASTGGRTSQSGQYPVTSVAVGDFNRDGIQDLAVANFGTDNVAILLGNGSGKFTPSAQSPIGVGINPSSVAIGDFDRDGIQDLAVANDGGNVSVSVLLGNGSGNFSASSGSPFGTAGNSPYSVSVADFNGDGIQDLAVVNAFSNNVDILLGDGNGSFAEAAISPLAVGTEPVASAVADFNGDGIEDVVVANWTDGTVTVFLGFATGLTPQTITFNAPVLAAR